VVTAIGWTLVTVSVVGLAIVSVEAIKLWRSKPLSSRGEEAKPKERNDKQHECAEGPNCDFCRGMEAYIASDVRREMDARLRSSTVAVNMALADIAEHEPDVRLIERMVLAEEGQQ
jgi:hypothetical protein